jgi:hypothetical protein
MSDWVAKKITSWEEKLDSSALDSYRNKEAGVKRTATECKQQRLVVELSKGIEETLIV